ncbi:hypothetical protein [Sulfurimonas sp.]|uniref:hypothetical protein n=1 Tax=Sulfurimonas sp. TaxID=2022749 RepID=UPI003D12784F
MKYLIKAKIKQKTKLMEAIQNETIGQGSVAFGEYLKNMKEARELDDGTICWIEVCFCDTPLNEELPYWEEYFEDIVIENAHDPKNCQDFNDKEKRACFNCKCTKKLEIEMLSWGTPFLTKV